MTRRLRLGPWEVHADGNRLRRDGETVRLDPKVMDLLAALAARPGEVLSREELLDTVWRGAFVSDEVLTTAVYQLRRALGDDARGVLARLAPKIAEAPVPPSHVASLYAEIGDEGKALEWLERAWRSRDPGVFFLRYDSRWEPYLDHPRVVALLDRLSAPGRLSAS